MADYSNIYFKRTQVGYAIMRPNTAFVANNAGSIGNAEPWIQSDNRQLWVDAVCINPNIVISTNFGNTGLTASDEMFSSSTTQNSTSKLVTTTFSFDFEQMLQNISTSFNTFKIKSGNSNPIAIYNPLLSSTYNILLGSNLSFNSANNINQLDSEYIDSLEFLTGADIGQGYVADRLYLHVASTFGNDHYLLMDPVIGSQYSGGNKITITNGVINHDTTTVTSIPSSETLSHGSQFTAVTGVTTDTYGHLTGYTSKLFTLPAAEGSGGSSLVVQELQAISGGPIAQNTTETHDVTLKLTSGENEVVFTTPSPDSLNGSGNDTRFDVTSATQSGGTMTRYTVNMIIHTIDGGIIS